MTAAARKYEPVALPIVITELDRRRLVGLVETLRQRGGADAPYLEDLEVEIERADVVAPADVPSTIVTMNSTVEVEDVESGRKREVTVVFPEKARLGTHCISVLAPMGAALLGARVGQAVQWSAPRRAQTARILRVVYQPEAAGDFEL